MFAKPIEPTNSVLLVPHSGVQFVEYAFDIDGIARFSRRFIERQFTDEQKSGEIPVRLLQGWNDDDPALESDEELRATDVEYTINKEKALEPFLNKWVPVPYLRIKSGRDQLGRERFDKGPTNWARVRVVADPAKKAGEGARYLAIFAFDTYLSPVTTPERDGAPYPYHSPIFDDARNPREFRFISKMSMLGWFLADPQPAETGDMHEDFQAWVVDWIKEMFLELRRVQKGRELREGDLPYQLEHAARWLAFLELLEQGARPQKVRLVDTMSGTSKPVEVDLVLDIGNSRTCGILIENYPNQDVLDLTEARVLELRDLSKPELIYGDPFESRVELARAEFGPEHLSRQSGKTKAFFWPSFVRVGPEASRFRAQQKGTEAITGMSSPKRYLWDINEVNQEWRFPAEHYTKGGDGPPIERAIRGFVNSTGEVLSQLKRPKDNKLFRSLFPDRRDLMSTSSRLTFSRSSFYTFMLVEIIWQAWVMINSERFRGERRERALPRKLRKIILTLPTATPAREQRIVRARAEAAIDLLWDFMGWNDQLPEGVSRPEVKVSWDEATCVQFVWMYGEIARKRFGIREFFDLTGKPRKRCEPEREPAPDAVNESSLRVASIDIGGGTTDLMIVTYYQDDSRQIIPTQTFREGARIAGDDMVKSLIENIVVPAFAAALEAGGMREPRRFLAERLGSGRAGMSEQDKQLRRQFTLRVLEPIALALIHAYEDAGSNAYDRSETTTVAALLGDTIASLPKSTRDYLEGPAHDMGVPISLEDIPIQLDFKDMRSAITSEMDKVLDNVSEAINYFDCDVVLVSGRPSRIPAVMEAIVDRIAVPPNRILALHTYRAGDWYPFRGRDGRSIADPKTAVVVGAMLCLLAEHQLQNFRLDTGRIQMRSTARFIGEIERGGRHLRDERILFRESELGTPEATRPKTLKWYATMQLGYRQVPFERWLASPLYQLSLKPGVKVAVPIEVTLERDPPDNDPDNPDALLDIEAAKEELRLDSSNKSQMSLTFRTMPLEDSYWLDTGIVQVI